jgi:hypothetical protein
MPKSLARQSTILVRSQFFNIDNGAGTTIDEPMLSTGGRPARIVRIYAVYGGADYVAATAYENSKAVGVATESTLVTDVIPPSTTVFVRHTGVAVTQTGTASICIELAYDE